MKNSGNPEKFRRTNTPGHTHTTGQNLIVTSEELNRSLDFVIKNLISTCIPLKISENFVNWCTEMRFLQDDQLISEFNLQSAVN